VVVGREREWGSWGDLFIGNIDRENS